ncbi:MAG: barstar family protein [Clostridia bacterium]|jgi:ribonuclease inhibitor|nr:barstar family protein [Clostridia bacterium]
MLVLCDFERLATPEAVYDYLQQELSFPDWFGRNLDALHDCLTDISAPTRLILTGTATPCGQHFVRVFRDAARQNRNLSVELHEE